MEIGEVNIHIGKIMDIHYENQKIYCANNKLPLFAHSICHHNYSWKSYEDVKDAPTKLGDILIDKYGKEKAFEISAGSLITSCPFCCKSWCD